MLILQRYDWAPQPCTANCSFMLVRYPLGENQQDEYAVYTWNRDSDFGFEGDYFPKQRYTEALEELLRRVQQYEKRFGQAYPGHWVFETEER